MIPIRDDNPTRTTPYVVYALVALNVLCYIVDLAGARGNIGGLWRFSMVPAQIVTGQNVPARIGNYLVAHPSPDPVWITIFTSMFLHGGLIHIGGNMLYLWIFGNNIEDVLGHIKFIFFYFTGGAIAAGAHILSNPASQVPTIGASGAIAAVLGAYMVLYPTRRVICLVLLGFFFTTIAVPAVVVLGLWVFLQFINAAVTGGGMTPGVGGVAYWAHIGGFAAGVVGILLLGGQRLVRQRWYDRPLRRNWYEE